MADETVDILIRARNEINAQFRDLEDRLKSVKTNAEATSGPGGLSQFASNLGITRTGALAAAASLVVLAKDALDAGGKLADLNAKTGLSIESLGRLQYSAELTGSTVDQFAQASLQLGKRLAEGDQSAVRAIEKLGLNFDELRKMAPGTQLEAISEAFSGVANFGDRAAIAMALFGKSGAELLPALMENLKATGDEAERLGILTEQDVKNLDDLGDSMTKLKLAGKAAFASVFADVIAVGKGVSDILERVNALTPAWVKLFSPSTAIGLVAAADELPKIKDGILQTSQAMRPFNEGLERQKAIEKELAETLKASNAQRDESEKATREQEKAIAALTEQTEKQNKQILESITSIFPTHLEMLATENALLEQGTAALLNRIRAEDVMLEKLKTKQQVVLATLGPQARGENAGADATGFANLSGLGDLFSGGNLASLVLAASQGGNFGGALGAGFGTAAFGSIGNKLGLSAGSFLGTLLPGIGGILGGLAGPLFKKLSGVFTGGEEALVVNPQRDAFLSSFGGAGTGAGSGFLTLAQKLTELTGQAGGGDVFAKLMNAKTAEEFEAAVRGVNAALDETAEKTEDLGDDTERQFSRMGSLAEKYGIDLASLGPAFNDARLGDQAKGLIEDFEFLISQGGDVGGVLFGMREELSDFVRESMRFGTEIPAAMRPWIDELVRSGNLLDENGQAITDISKLKFAAPIEAGFEEASAGVDSFADKVRTDLPSAAEDAAREITEILSKITIAPIRIPVEVDMPNTQGAVPGYAFGSRGVRDFGSGTLAVLHGREAVLTESQLYNALNAASLAGDGAGSSLTVNVNAPGAIFRDRASMDELADRVSDAVLARMKINGRLSSAAFA